MSLSAFSDKWYSLPQLKGLEASTGLKFPRGKFTVREATLLHKSLLSYLKGQGMTLEVFQDTLVHRERRVTRALNMKEMYVHLAMRLGTGRPVLAVYHYVRRKYHPSVHNQVDGSGLKTGDGNHPLLSSRVNREEVDEEGKGDFGLTGEISSYIELMPDLTKRNRRANWTLEEDQQLRTAVLEFGSCWEKVGLQLNVTPMACLQRWRHISPTAKRNKNDARATASKCEKQIWTRGKDLEMIQRLYDLNYEFEEDIYWRQVQQPSSGDIENSLSAFSPEALRSRFNFLKKNTPKEILLQSSLDDLLEFLMTQHLSENNNE